MISAGKQMSKNDSSFAALKSRLAQGKGKMSEIARDARAHKSQWAKGKAKSAAKGNPTFAVSGATPGVKKPGNKA